MAGTREARRAPADKYDERRDQLAESALRTLGERGYARTSLREIANNSAYSHGVVHYYFADKLELVVYSVRYYKARCVTRYDGVVADSTTAEDLLDRFAPSRSYQRLCIGASSCTVSTSLAANRSSRSSAVVESATTPS